MAHLLASLTRLSELLGHGELFDTPEDDVHAAVASVAANQEDMPGLSSRQRGAVLRCLRPPSPPSQLFAARPALTQLAARLPVGHWPQSGKWCTTKMGACRRC